MMRENEQCDVTAAPVTVSTRNVCFGTSKRARDVVYVAGSAAIICANPVVSAVKALVKSPFLLRLPRRAARKTSHFTIVSSLFHASLKQTSVIDNKRGGLFTRRGQEEGGSV